MFDFMLFINMGSICLSFHGRAISNNPLDWFTQITGAVGTAHHFHIVKVYLYLFKCQIYLYL